MNILREFWDSVFAIREREPNLDELTPLDALIVIRQDRVEQCYALDTTPAAALEMGILCAQLGLTPETLCDAARLYVKSLQ